jgi:hypothetical protein
MCKAFWQATGSTGWKLPYRSEEKRKWLFHPRSMLLILCPPQPVRTPRRRVRIGIILTLLGYAMFLLGARPDLFGADRSPVIGFVQIAFFLVGLGVICIGGYISLMALWKGQTPSIPADIGQRLVATGFVLTIFSGMADIFGFGSHPLPGVPYFGPLQARGVIIGEAIITIGFLLLIPPVGKKDVESKK